MNSIRTKLKSTKSINSTRKLFVEAEKRHIQAHLALTELRLRLKGSKKSESRQAALDTLHGYWKAGVFPVNTYKKNERVPVFIDEKGTYCAVGYLMAQTGYSSLAHEIDQNDKFALVENLQNEKAEAWLDAFGLKREEAALIQPTYDHMYPETESALPSFDMLFAAVTLLFCLLLIVGVVVVLRIMNNPTIKKQEKNEQYLKIAMGSITILVCLLFLPSPSEAIDTLNGTSTSTDRIRMGF